MQYNKISGSLIWKELKTGVSVTHFPSRREHQQIYIKRIHATKKTQKPVTIFLFHDLSSYHGRFMKLVNFFKVQCPEINFILMDFLGHGLSSGTRGHIADFYDLANDMAYVFSSLEKEENETWISLGQGVGALGILDLINRFDDSVKGKIDKLILSNFILNFNSPALNLQEKFLGSFATLKTTRFIPVYLPEEILGHSKDQSKYLDDPLIVRRPTYQSFKCINSAVRGIHQSAYFLDRPTLILESSSRYLIPGGINAFSKGLKKELLTQKKYSNLKHDLYNEHDNSHVFNDIAQWIHS